METTISAHIATCTERAKINDAIAAEIEELKGMKNTMRGGWIVLALLGQLIMSAAVLAVTLFKG